MLTLARRLASPTTARPPSSTPRSTWPTAQVLAVLGPERLAASRRCCAPSPGSSRPPPAGSRWDGDDLAGVPTHKRGFALMFQDGQLFSHLTVARNVGYALRLRRTPNAAARVARAARAGRAGGVRRPAARHPLRRRAAAGRAGPLARRASRGCCCSTSRSPPSTRGCASGSPPTCATILREAGTTALMVTHDHEEAFTVADRLAVMRAGRIVQQGDIAAGLAGAGRRGDGAVPRLRPGARGRAGRARCSPRPACRRRRRRSPYAAPPWPSPTPGRWRGSCVSARATPEQIRLVVDVDGIGEVDAVARLDTHPAPGDRVALGGRRHAGWPRHRPVTELDVFPTLACVYRRAYVLLVGNAVLMGGAGDRGRDRLRQAAGRPRGQLPRAVLAAAAAAALRRARCSTCCRGRCGTRSSNPRLMPAIVRDRWRTHWNRERLTLVALGISLLLRRLRQLPEPEVVPAVRARHEVRPRAAPARPGAALRPRPGDRAAHAARHGLRGLPAVLRLPVVPAAGAARGHRPGWSGRATCPTATGS